MSRFALRDGAGPGDRIWATAPFFRGGCGGAAAPMQAGPGSHAWAPVDQALVSAHARPRPAVAEGVVARLAGATAMIDVSDGLAADLDQDCSKSLRWPGLRTLAERPRSRGCRN